MRYIKIGDTVRIKEASGSKYEGGLVVGDVTEVINFDPEEKTYLLRSPIRTVYGGGVFTVSEIELVKAAKPTHRYKIGDTVRCISDYKDEKRCGFIKKGDLFEIIALHGGFLCRYYVRTKQNSIYKGGFANVPIDQPFSILDEHEIELVEAEKPKQKKQKHIFVRVDKRIEPGDLVRCIEDDFPCKKGDIRRAVAYDSASSYLNTYTFAIAYQEDNMLMGRTRWEVIHKLKVGDQITFGKDDEVHNVTIVDPWLNRFWAGDEDPLGFRGAETYCLYHPETEDEDSVPIEPVNYGLNKIEPNGEAYGTDWAGVTDKHVNMQWENPFHNNSSPGTMKTAVAEMIVELLDKETAISLGAYFDIGLTMVEVLWCGQSLGEAELHPNDKWDTLTGLYVALLKATNRKLPNWIYEKESNDE